MSDAAEMSFDPRMTLGTTGLKEHAGVINEEFLSRLQGQNAIKLFTEMKENSPVLATALDKTEMLIRETDWRVSPANESDEAKAEAEDTEGALEDMEHTFDTMLSEILSMLWAGHSELETVYKIRRGPDSKDKRTRSKYNDGKWGWRKHEIRAQDTIDHWLFDDDNDLKGFVQNSFYSGNKNRGPIVLPMAKILHFRTKIHKGNPEGKSLLRPAVIPYWFIKRIQDMEATGIERNLAGMPFFEVPPEILVPDAPAPMKALRRVLEEFITQIRVNERWGGLVPTSLDREGKPTGFKFQVVTSTGRKLVDTDVVIRRHRAEMLMLFMAQFMVMGTGGEGGNRAISGDMVDLFGSALTAIMDIIAAVMNHDMIPRRQRLNGVPPELDPIIEHGDIRGPRLKEVGAYLKDIMSTGAVGPHPALERRLLEIGDLPQPPDEDAQPGPGLSENKIDAVSRTAFSAEQVKTILEVNGALKKGTLDRASAMNTLALALGMTPEDAEQFIPAAELEEETPEAPTKPSVARPQATDDGSDKESEGLDEDEDMNEDDV